MIAGLLLGILIGLLLGPVIRSWLAWREYVEASREARLTDELLRLMSEPPFDDGSASSRNGPSPRRAE